MIWTKTQHDCLRRIYLAILSQEDQTNDEGTPLPGTRLQTLHRYAYAIEHVNPAIQPPIKKEDALNKLSDMFTLLDPSFAKEFANATDRAALFTALGKVVANADNKKAAPYNVPNDVGLMY